MTVLSSLSTRSPGLVTAPRRAALGVLSVHLQGGVCRVGCEFCYLGSRAAPEPLPRPAEGGPESPADEEPALAQLGRLVGDALGRLDYAEVAVAVSEPVGPVAPALGVIVRAAAARGRPVAVTTTVAVASSAPALFAGVRRLGLSVDPRKGPTAPAQLAELIQALRRLHPGLEVVAIASLTTQAFAACLIEEGLLATLVELPELDGVVLNGLKPPPPWCDRAFWMQSLAALLPLLERSLDRRLYLDCYVAARLLGLGDCPARPDLSPAPGGLAFRACVYQPAPDFVVADGAALAARLEGFTAPASCPFPIR